MNKRLGLSLTIVTMFLAQTSFANVVGTDVQNFNTTSNGIDFITVQSSETLEPGILNMGLFFNYARNTLPYFEDPPGTPYSSDDSLTMADFNVGIGLAKNLDVGLNFPWLLYQTNNSRSANIEYLGRGNAEVRFNSKLRLWGNQSRGAGIVGTMSVNRVEDSPFVGRGGGPAYSLEAVGDTSYKRIAFGANFGYRWRTPGDPVAGFPIKPYRNQVIASGAASYLIPGMPVKLITEIYSAWPARYLGDVSDRFHTISEWIAGLKIDASREVAVHIGGGGRLSAETASPDWRVYSGVNWATGPIFGEKPTAADVEEAKSQGQPQPITSELANLAPIKGESTFTAPEVLFKFDSDVPDSVSAQALLEPLVIHMKKDPIYKHLAIKGHTDSIGVTDYNDRLSLRRAVNVKKALIEIFKLEPDKITAVGFGETQPVADNGNYQGRKRNRRVEFTITR